MGKRATTRALACAAAAALLAWSSCADARRVAAKDLAIRLIADATAWSELCVNYGIDPQAVARFQRAEKIPVNGHYRDVFGLAYTRDHNEAMDHGDFPVSCDRALDLYGPRGARRPGLVRPLWNGTVRKQKIDTFP